MTSWWFSWGSWWGWWTGRWQTAQPGACCGRNSTRRCQTPSLAPTTSPCSGQRGSSVGSAPVQCAPSLTLGFSPTVYLQAVFHLKLIKHHNNLKTAPLNTRQLHNSTESFLDICRAAGQFSSRDNKSSGPTMESCCFCCSNRENQTHYGDKVNVGKAVLRRTEGAVKVACIVDHLFISQWLKFEG